MNEYCRPGYSDSFLTSLVSKYISFYAPPPLNTEGVESKTAPPYRCADDNLPDLKTKFDKLLYELDSIPTVQELHGKPCLWQSLQFNMQWQ